MKYELYIAQRLAKGAGGSWGQSQPRLINLSISGVAISLMVMLISLAIILGFKRQITSFANSQTGNISLYAPEESWTSTSKHIRLPLALRTTINSEPYVSASYPILQQMAMLKTNEGFAGLMLYGVDSAFRHPFFTQGIIKGGMPSFSSLDSLENPIVLPRQQAQEFGLSIGDRVRMYFMNGDVRVRSFILAGIYESGGIDRAPALCSSGTLRRLGQLQPDQYNRLLIMLHYGEEAEACANRLAQVLESSSQIGRERYMISTSEELLPELFGWLSLLDSNVIFLIVIMLIVGAFTMITGLIIIVLDKTKHIGLLKALGSSDRQIRRIFALIAVRLILFGLLWGNILAGIFCFVQSRWQIIKLDAHSYFMDAVPIAVDGWVWLAVNVGTFLLISLVILVPTRIITNIHPADIMRID